MARGLCIVGIWFALTAAAHAACTPQMVADLQARGASPQLIAQMCSGGQPGFAPASVCVTNFGVCPFRGPINVACSCVGQLGTFPGVSR